MVGEKCRRTKIKEIEMGLLKKMSLKAYFPESKIGAFFLCVPIRSA